MKRHGLSPKTISMHVRSDSGFLSEYSGEEPIISEEVAGYLRNRMRAFATSQFFPLTIQISSSEITEDEAKIYEKAIRNYYASEQRQLKKDLAINKITALSMFLIGFSIIGLLVAFADYAPSKVIEEVLNIVGWVFIWESAHNYFFRRHAMKVEYNQFESIVKANIVFQFV